MITLSIYEKIFIVFIIFNLFFFRFKKQIKKQSLLLKKIQEEFMKLVKIIFSMHIDADENI